MATPEELYDEADRLKDEGKLDELRYVLGVTQSLYLQISPYVTVFSGRAGVDLEYAPPRLVSALTGREIEALEAPLAEPTRAAASGTFHIYTSVSVGKRSAFSLEAVVRLSNEDDRPFTILYWQEGTTAPLSVQSGSRI